MYRKVQSSTFALESYSHGKSRGFRVIRRGVVRGRQRIRIACFLSDRLLAHLEDQAPTQIYSSEAL